MTLQKLLEHSHLIISTSEKYIKLPSSVSAYFSSSFNYLDSCSSLLGSMQVPLIRLQCGVNSYDWGKIGKSSAAATFAAATNDFSIDEDTPYAEVSHLGL